MDLCRKRLPVRESAARFRQEKPHKCLRAISVHAHAVDGFVSVFECCKAGLLINRRQIRQNCGIIREFGGQLIRRAVFQHHKILRVIKRQIIEAHARHAVSARRFPLDTC